MSPNRNTRLALALALAAACKPIAVESATPGESTASSATAVDPELAEIARRIDPGPQPAQDAKRVEETGRACVEPSDEAPKASPRVGGATTGADEEKSEPPATSKPEGPAPLPVAKGSATPRRSVGRLVGRSVLAGVGVGLLGWMAGAVVGAVRADATVANITVRATGPIQSADYHSVRRLRRTAIAVGIGAAVALVYVLVIDPIRARVRAKRAKRAREAMYSKP